jgi:tRNA(Ile)-lysidine synthase
VDLQREVVAFIHRERLLSPGDRVVVGVSGGPDSLALLHLVHACREQLGIEVHAAHLNHLIRGTEADQDAQFVADVASAWDIPCTVVARDVPAFARDHRLALEEAARRVRYAFLAEVAQSVGGSRIAVGHNADDQSETVLMHWLRGAGLAGLRGMLPATPLADLRLSVPRAELRGMWLVRPLLETPRKEIEQYCQQHNLHPRFDRSNLDTTLYRNKLRHELLPLLEQEYKPHLAEILRRSAQVFRADYDLLRQLRDSAWQDIVRTTSSQAVVFDRSAWASLHLSLQRATVRRAVMFLRKSLRDVNFSHVDAAVSVGRQGIVGLQATLPHGVVLTVGYETLTLADEAYAPAPDFPSMAGGLVSPRRVALAIPGIVVLSERATVEAQLVLRADLPYGWSENRDSWRAFLDVAVLGERAYLRGRRPGDRFCPLGMGGQHKLVSEFLVNEKIPAGWRDRIPLLVREDGEIMWVCGWRLDERARVTSDTTRVAVVRLVAIGDDGPDPGKG